MQLQIRYDRKERKRLQVCERCEKFILWLDLKKSFYARLQLRLQYDVKFSNITKSKVAASSKSVFSNVNLDHFQFLSFIVKDLFTISISQHFLQRDNLFISREFDYNNGFSSNCNNAVNKIIVLVINLFNDQKDARNIKGFVKATQDLHCVDLIKSYSANYSSKVTFMKHHYKVLLREGFIKNEMVNGTIGDNSNNFMFSSYPIDIYIEFLSCINLALHGIDTIDYFKSFLLDTYSERCLYLDKRDTRFIPFKERNAGMSKRRARMLVKKNRFAARIAKEVPVSESKCNSYDICNIDSSSYVSEKLSELCIRYIPFSVYKENYGGASISMFYIGSYSIKVSILRLLLRHSTFIAKLYKDKKTSLTCHIINRVAH
jgi:hypothetical protein